MLFLAAGFIFFPMEDFCDTVPTHSDIYIDSDIKIARSAKFKTGVLKKE